MYPENIDSFVEKLNKLDNNTYVIEEEVKPINGVYEGELKHDNISNSSLRVYTGSKLTGDKIENFILSTPSNTPWKKSIKVFSNSQKVYITYETQGDTVEAEDINILQESIVNTQTEIDRYKTSNDNEVLNLKNRATSLENGKAAKTYVDTELAKKMDKTSAYTKTETDQRIQNVVGAAPAALDTLKELADALGNDANFTGTMTSALSNKVDKVSGKQFSTEDYTTTEKSKLAGIAASANNYVHPSTHAATIIVEDSTHRFATDTEKANWNDANSKKHTHSNKSIIDAITQTLIDTWNSAYSHISDVVKHITDEERTLWNTVSNKVDKETGKVLSTNDFTSAYKSKVDGITTGATKVESSSTNGNIKINGTEKTVYTHPANHDDRYYTESEVDLKFATKEELSSNTGDMYKSVYDPDGDGKINYTDLLNKPSSLPANGGNADTVDNKHASDFAPAGFGLGNVCSTATGDWNNYKTTGFFMGSSLANECPGSSWRFCIVMRHNDIWTSQTMFDFQGTTIYQRNQSNGTWGAWRKILTNNQGITWNDLKGV